MNKINANEMISKIAEKIRDGYKPQKIVLFGSYAYGKPDEDSDIDLLIIKDTEKSSMDRWMEVRKILRDFNNIIPIPISPLIYTEKELEETSSFKRNWRRVKYYMDDYAKPCRGMVLKRRRRY